MPWSSKCMPRPRHSSSKEVSFAWGSSRGENCRDQSKTWNSKTQWWHTCQQFCQILLPSLRQNWSMQGNNTFTILCVLVPRPWHKGTELQLQEVNSTVKWDISYRSIAGWDEFKTVLTVCVCLLKAWLHYEWTPGQFMHNRSTCVDSSQLEDARQGQNAQREYTKIDRALRLAEA